MHYKFLLSSSVLLLFVLFLTYIDNTVATTAVPGTTGGTTPTAAATTTTRKSYTRKPHTKPYKKYNYGYGNNYGGYDDDYYGDNDGYRGRYELTGYDGKDPRKYGQDIGDYGPIYDNQASMSGLLDVWISSADDWESKDKSKYRGRGRDSYGKDKNYKGDKGKNDRYRDRDSYDNDNGDEGYRKKRSYSRVRFPVRHFPNIRRFPLGRFPPLISIFPWLPIFYDRITYQTFIFSPTGGIYILPPLINFYGRRFAVAQLIRWGYASLVSSGAPPPPNVNVAPLVQPAPAAGAPVTTGVVGSPNAGPPPAYDAAKVRFTDGIRTDFPNFKPRYGNFVNEGQNRNSGSSYGNNYGGGDKQQVYPQGGPRGGGGGYGI